MTKFILDYVLARLQERSTWLGLISFLSGMGIHVAPEWSAAIACVGMSVAGAVLMVTKDHKTPVQAIQAEITDAKG